MSNYLKQIFFVVGLIGFTSTAWAQSKCNPSGADAGYKLIWKLNSLDSFMDVACKLEESGLQFGGDFTQSFGNAQKIVPNQGLFGELAGIPYWAGGSRFIFNVSKFPIGQTYCDAKIEMDVRHSDYQMYFLAAVVAGGRTSSVLPTEEADLVIGGYIKNIELACAEDEQTVFDNLVIDFESADPNALSMSPSGAAVLSYEQQNGLFSAEYIISYPGMQIEHADPWMHPLAYDAMMKVARLSLQEKDYEYNNLEQRKLKNN